MKRTVVNHLESIRLVEICLEDVTCNFDVVVGVDRPI